MDVFEHVTEIINKKIPNNPQHWVSESASAELELQGSGCGPIKLQCECLGSETWGGGSDTTVPSVVLQCIIHFEDGSLGAFLKGLGIYMDKGNFGSYVRKDAFF